MTTPEPRPVLPYDWRLERAEETGSTNDEARRLALAGHGEGTVFWAAAQNAGRGRRGRPWRSLPGNLHVSVVLDAPAQPACASQAGFVAAVALTDAVSALLPAGPLVTCKWPNDLLVDGRKVAGLLLETEARRPWIILGLGVNVKKAPPVEDGLRTPAACLAEFGSDAPAARVLEVFCAHLAVRLKAWRTEGFGHIRGAWLKRAAGLGGAVSLETGGVRVGGVMAGIDDDGALLLRPSEGGGLRRIVAGELVVLGEGT